MTSEQVTAELSGDVVEPEPSTENISAEEDQQETQSDTASQAVEVIGGLMDLMGFEAEIERIDEDERIEIDLNGPDAGRIIGKKGQTLDALQFIVNKMVNRFPEGRRHVILDVEDYKERRDDSLRDMANRLAQKASRSGRVITVNPMPSRERRVIHLALADFPGVSTRSDGLGTERRVRIIPEGARRRSR